MTRTAIHIRTLTTINLFTSNVPTARHVSLFVFSPETQHAVSTQMTNRHFTRFDRRLRMPA